MNPRCAGESSDSLRRCGTYCKSNYQHTKQTMLIHKLRCTLLRGLYQHLPLHPKRRQKNVCSHTGNWMVMEKKKTPFVKGRYSRSSVITTSHRIYQRILYRWSKHQNITYSILVAHYSSSLCSTYTVHLMYGTGQWILLTAGLICFGIFLRLGILPEQ